MDIPGNYSRPICRRIVEEAVVNRNYFGIKNKAVSVLLGSNEDTISPFLRESITAWLHKHKSEWSSIRKVSPYKGVKSIQRFSIPLRLVSKGIHVAIRIAPTGVKPHLLRLSKKLKNLNADSYLLNYAFAWAIEKVQESYTAYYKLDKRET